MNVSSEFYRSSTTHSFIVSLSIHSIRDHITFVIMMKFTNLGNKSSSISEEEMCGVIIMLNLIRSTHIQCNGHKREHVV